MLWKQKFERIVEVTPRLDEFDNVEFLVHELTSLLYRSLLATLSTAAANHLGWQKVSHVLRDVAKVRRFYHFM